MKEIKKTCQKYFIIIKKRHHITSGDEIDTEIIAVSLSYDKLHDYLIGIISNHKYEEYPPFGYTYYDYENGIGYIFEIREKELAIIS